MKFWTNNFKDGEKIPKEFAFIKKASLGHFFLSNNHNPHLEWDELPAETQSLVLIVHDPDAPLHAENVNQEYKTLPILAPRCNFYHWILVDLPPEGSPILEGEFSNQVSPHGKFTLNGPRNTRQGKNDFSVWFQGNKDMEGNYFGYDGPAPPWNDELVHRYFFTLYALKEKRCPVRGLFNAQKVLEVIGDLILDKAQFTGTYSIFSKTKSKLPEKMALSPN